jgi:hypothetical protein
MDDRRRAKNSLQAWQRKVAIWIDLAQDICTIAWTEITIYLDFRKKCLTFCKLYVTKSENRFGRKIEGRV